MGDPHFTAVEIQAFRGLRNVRLEGLGRVNILVGNNNVGKTSVLEGVFLCCAPFHASGWFEMATHRSSSGRESMSDSLAWLFPRTHATPNLDGSLRLAFHRTGVPYRSVLDAKLTIRQRLADRDVGEVGRGHQSNVISVPYMAIELTNDGSPSGPTSPQRCDFSVQNGSVIPSKSTAEDAQAAMITPIGAFSDFALITTMARNSEVGDRDRIVALLRQFDPGIISVEVYDESGSRSALRVWHKKTGATPIGAFGDGFRRVFGYAQMLVDCRDGVLLVDEIETAIHYSALKDVYAWLVRGATDYNVQLFVTTHSLEAIDALLEATPETPDTVFYRLYDVGNGTEVVRLEEQKLRSLREQLGAEVRG